MSFYCIGSNNHQEFGLDNKTIQKLTLHTNENIIDVKSGRDYNIYIDKNGNYFSCGSNQYGECGIGNFNKIIHKLTEITYFKENNIQIKKICVSIGGSTTFWITNKNELYGNGRNDKGQLGVGDDENKSIPILITHLNNVIHVKSASFYSIALCSSPDNSHIALTKIKKIINYYSCVENKYRISISNGIINLIMLFYGNINVVYATAFSYNGGNGHGLDAHIHLKGNKWYKINKLQNIVAVHTGTAHSLFLEVNGTVWCCGNNHTNQLGLGDYYDADINNIYVPTKIKYLIENNIKIKHISCGYSHNLLIDRNNKIYSFGKNTFAECGHHEIAKNIAYPKLIDKQMNAKFIKCGAYHSYICTLSNRHYLFGFNEDNECVKIHDKVDHDDNEDEYNLVKIPYLINKSIEEQFNNKSIQNVYCGVFNTMFILK